MPVQAGGVIDPASRIRSIIATQEPKIREAFLVAVSTIISQSTLSELADLLEAGRIEEALAGLERAAEHIAGASGQALNAAALGAAEFISGAVGVTVSFDQTNFRAVDIIRASRLELISQFTSEQRAATRLALKDGVARGLNPREQARNFRSSIGLTAKQQQSVMNFRNALERVGIEGELAQREALSRSLRDHRFDRTIVNAIEDGTPLTAAQIDKMVTRYRTRYIAFRAETIARTEALRAVHQGTEEMYRQAIDVGELDPEQLVRKWVTARDERVRSTHRGLNGAEKGIGEPWVTINGRLRFPGDPLAPASEVVKCRCVLTTRIKEL